jgi:hypothetical protein
MLLTGMLAVLEEFIPIADSRVLAEKPESTPL